MASSEMASRSRLNCNDLIMPNYIGIILPNLINDLIMIQKAMFQKFLTTLSN